MKNTFERINSNPLFAGIDANDFETMVSCINGNTRKYRRGEIVQLAGNPVATIGIVVTGLVHVVREDLKGQQQLLTEITEGELFGEVFACVEISSSPVTVLAVEESTILHINYRKLVNHCSSACVFHQRLIKNMLTIIAQKNLLLNKKLEILSKRGTRERLLLFFDMQRNGAKRFVIPYNRDELAAYLCVERSAMSAELSRMQSDGVIRYTRNEVELL